MRYLCSSVFGQTCTVTYCDVECDDLIGASCIVLEQSSGSREEAILMEIVGVLGGS
jgi:hypothetical protein